MTPRQSLFSAHTHTTHNSCHSNATRAPIANPPNCAQLGGSLYHAAKLHPGPCSSVGVRPRTDRQTHRQTHRRAWPQYILRRLRLTQNVMRYLYSAPYNNGHSNDAPYVKLLWPLVIFGHAHLDSRTESLGASSRVLYCGHSTQYSHLVTFKVNNIHLLYMSH